MRAVSIRSHRGFTVIEMLVSMALMVGILGVIFSLVDPARGTYRAQPEVSDMQQRLRIGATFLGDDLVQAGAGVPTGQLVGSLMNFFAPIQPYRLGMINSDTEAGVFFRDDTITVFYIPPNAPQTTLSAAMPQPSSELKVHAQVNCPAVAPLCGFKENQRVIIFDDTGAYDDMTITEVQEAALHLQHNKSIPGNELSKKYGVGAQVAQIQQRTYYRSPATNQLMYYDGDQRDEAVVDNVIVVGFEYFGDPRPAQMLRPVTDPVGPWTTYGPKPPPLGSTTTSWPAGENCTIQINAGTGTHGPRLPDLAPGSEGLVALTEGMLTDGPWCPDATFPTRYDADLLRIRKVGIRFRVQVGSAALRGPASALFVNPGTAIEGRTLVPDQEIRFDVSPRNFNLGR
jgi:prepilin-type N-terminal cleavage/methylation domain-containing protein